MKLPSWPSIQVHSSAHSFLYLDNIKTPQTPSLYCSCTICFHMIDNLKENLIKLAENHLLYTCVYILWSLQSPDLNPTEHTIVREILDRRVRQCFPPPLLTVSCKQEKADKRKDLSNSDKVYNVTTWQLGQRTIEDPTMTGLAKFSLYAVVITYLYLKVFQGSSVYKPATTSWAPKANWCTLVVKYNLSAPIGKTHFHLSFG